MHWWYAKLPKGYVSDEVNTLFSALELKLARNSPITLPRMFIGPGKRGSHNPKRRGGASKIVSVMKLNEMVCIVLDISEWGRLSRER